MKAHHLALLYFAIGLAIGAGAIVATRKPCPTPDIPPPSQAAIQRETRRDSIAERRALRASILDSLSHTQPREINIRIARSLSRVAQLDSLLSAPR